MNWPAGRRLLAAALTLVFSLALVSGAHAAGFDDMGQLSPPSLDQAADPQVAFAKDGSAWLIWDGDEVDLQHIAADGTTGAPITLDSSNYSGGPQLAVTPSGGVVAAWWNGNSNTIKVVDVSAGGTPGTVRDIGSSVGESFALSIDGSGVASVAYMDSTSLSVQRFAGGDVSGSPIPVWSTTDSNQGPYDVQLATTPSGDSVITWEHFRYETSPPYYWHITRHAALLSQSGTLGSDHVLADDTLSGPSNPAAVMTPSGDAYVLYNAAPSGQQGELKLAKLSSSDDLTAVATLDSDASTVDFPDLVRSSTGTLTALWEHVDPSSDYTIVSRRVASDGTVSPPVGSPPDSLTDTSQSAYGYSLSSLSTGSALAVFGVYTTDYQVLTSVIDPSAGPGPATERAAFDGSSYFGTVASAADSSGNGIAVWAMGPDYSHSALFGAYFDEVGPSIDSFGAPTSGTAGDQMVFGTASSDRSGIKSTSWDFGDGAHGSGAIASHAFAAPGTYTVTATVTDNADNTTTKSQQVVVRSASSGAGGSGGSGGSLKARLTGLHATVHLGRKRMLVLHLPAQPVDAFGSVLVRANGGHAARLVTLGSRQFPVFHGKAVTLRIKLSAKTIKLAKRLHGHRLKTTVRLTLTGFDGKAAAKTYRVTIRG